MTVRPVSRHVPEHGWGLFDRRTGARIGPWYQRRAGALAARGACTVLVSGDVGHWRSCGQPAVDYLAEADRLTAFCQTHLDYWAKHFTRGAVAAGGAPEARHG